MNNKAVGVAMFIIGAVAGTAATWALIKNKYEKLAMEEIDSVKTVFSKREASTAAEVNVREKANQAKEKPSVVEYAAKLQKEGYTNYSGINEEMRKGVDEMAGFSESDSPYVIAPDVFGEFDDYEKISLTYYADQILADDNDEIVDDVEDIVGFDSLSHFGDYEDDSVFVRNDRLKCDYEILLDQRPYSDIVKNRPRPIEGC